MNYTGRKIETNWDKDNKYGPIPVNLIIRPREDKGLYSKHILFWQEQSGERSFYLLIKSYLTDKLHRNLDDVYYMKVI